LYIVQCTTIGPNGSIQGQIIKKIYVELKPLVSEGNLENIWLNVFKVLSYADQALITDIVTAYRDKPSCGIITQ